MAIAAVGPGSVAALINSPRRPFQVLIKFSHHLLVYSVCAFYTRIRVTTTTAGPLVCLRMARILCIALVSCFLAYAAAHEHHDKLSEEEANAPVDNILWIHMFLQALVWGVMFPIGMVLGITRSRWHVPLQVSPFSAAVSTATCRAHC